MEKIHSNNYFYMYVFLNVKDALGLLLDALVSYIHIIIAINNLYNKIVCLNNNELLLCINDVYNRNTQYYHK